MTFIGVISDNKIFENINMHLKSDKFKLIHINKKSIENIKNIRFETIIIDSNLENFKQEENIIEQICLNSKYLIINTDINLKFNISNNNKINIITYGLNQKATITVSSITDTDVLIYLQRNIRTVTNKMVEVEEKRIKVNENNKLKIYEILIIYIIFLINNNCIIEQI
ncbi:MAG: hypothetical protein ACI4VH_05900 [Clostridia bacterium]